MKNKIIVLVSGVLVILLMVLGVTFAIFSYSRTGETSELVLGDIWMKYTETNGIDLKGAMPGDDYSSSDYFEFTITGTNTYDKKDIWYEIVLTKGELAEGKNESNRIEDKYLQFRLVEVNDGAETVLFTDVKYENLVNKRVWVETIGKGVENYSKTYRLYMIISEDLKIGNTSDSIMTMEVYENAFASVKVNVTGDFNEKEIGTDFVELLKSKYGTEESLVAVNTEGSLYDGTGTIREYRYSGATVNSNYVTFNGETWRILGIFQDTVKDANGNTILDETGNPTYEEKVKLIKNIELKFNELPENYTIDNTTYQIVDHTSDENNDYYNVAWSTIRQNDSTNWTSEPLQYYLNTEYDQSETPVNGYLSELSTGAKKIMSPSTYYLGNVSYSMGLGTVSGPANDVYNQERSDVVCDSSVNSESSANNCNIWYGNHDTWNGLVGLLHTSDYMYATNSNYWNSDNEDGGYTMSKNNWIAIDLSSNFTRAFISPSSYASHSIISLGVAGYFSSGAPNAAVKLGEEFNSTGIFPVITLKSNTKFMEGEGTKLKPYKLLES